MQNTKYENVVIATMQNLAALVSSAAHDSVVEKNNYNVIENVQALSYVFANYTQHTSIASLAAAALNSNLDTAVRENIHAQLTFIN
jgi:Ribonuclease G/E